MAVLLEQDKEAYLRSLKRVMTDCMRRASEEEFSMLIEKELPAFHFRQVRAPIVDEELLEHVNKVVDSINNYEVQLKKLEDTDVRDRKMFLYSVVEYVRSLKELVKQSKLSPETCKLIDIDAIQLVMEILWTNIDNTRVDAKRYASLSKYFLQDVLLKLKVCVSRQKQLMKAGLLYRAIKNDAFEEFVNCFHPSLATVPSEDSPSPLFCAVVSGNFLALSLLENYCPITCDIDVNRSNFNVLHHAARHRDADVMETLLMGAAKDTLSRLINAKSADLQTPLHVAAANENYDVVQLLCKYGACYSSLDGKNRAPASLCQEHRELTSFFEAVEKMFRLASEGKFEELQSYFDGSSHGKLALLHVTDDEGMTPMEVLEKKLEQQD